MAGRLRHLPESAPALRLALPESKPCALNAQQLTRRLEHTRDSKSTVFYRVVSEYCGKRDCLVPPPPLIYIAGSTRWHSQWVAWKRFFYDAYVVVVLVLNPIDNGDAPVPYCASPVKYRVMMRSDERRPRSDGRKQDGCVRSLPPCRFASL